jgi:hypothetical protein
MDFPDPFIDVSRAGSTFVNFPTSSFVLDSVNFFMELFDPQPASYGTGWQPIPTLFHAC